jgi:hypothetical protein
MENTEERTEEVSFDEIVEAPILPAPKGPFTNALVHNPFTYSDDTEE